MATIWKFRNSDDNFKKLLSVFTQMFIHFVWEGIAKTLDTSQNLLLVFTERWIHVQEFHHIRISFSEGNFKKPLLVFLVCPLFYLLLSNVFTGYPSTPTLQACPHTSFLLRTTTLFAVRRRIASNNHAVRSDIRGLPLCIHEVHSDTRGLSRKNSASHFTLPRTQPCFPSPLVFFCLGDGISFTASAYRGITNNAKTEQRKSWAFGWDEGNA